MYIRRTTIKSRSSGEPYYTYRLVESERIDGRVKQRTVLNLGRHFDVPKEDWPLLVSRIEQLLEAQGSLFGVELSEPFESLAQRYAANILHNRSELTAAHETVLETVDIASLELVRPRSVGVEALALQAMTQLGFIEQLVALGFNRHQRAATIGNIIARMAVPASEQATHAWLQQSSALGELLGYDYEGMADKRLYQASDLLLKAQSSLESHLFGQLKQCFALEETVTLYDLSNTFFEGQAQANTLAACGRSKEKRSDCPLVTLALVLDQSGFVKHSEIFAGNVSEAKTLETMLSALKPQPGAIIVMDAGIATQANIDWLVEQGYRYLAVSRQRHREFDETLVITVKQAANNTVKVQRRVNEETGEVELYCHSQGREKKEQAMLSQACQRFEAGLEKIRAGLDKKTGIKQIDKVNQRLGRLKEKYVRVAGHYEIRLEQDESSQKVTAIDWLFNTKPHTAASHPGVYCLRTNIQDWDEQTLWQTYTMLTDLEAVFRSLKSELGLRPIYHHKTERVKGHLFISVLAYQFVHLLRSQLKAAGIHDSWQTIRNKVATQHRITVTLKREDGKTLHIRKASNLEPHQKPLYQALKLKPECFGRTQKTVI